MNSRQLEKYRDALEGLLSELPPPLLSAQHGTGRVGRRSCCWGWAQQPLTALLHQLPTMASCWFSSLALDNSELASPRLGERAQSQCGQALTLLVARGPSSPAQVSSGSSPSLHTLLAEAATPSQPPCPAQPSPNPTKAERCSKETPTPPSAAAIYVLFQEDHPFATTFMDT